ncbi:MAG: DUF177 domain-containing protein [Bacteroidales bacterium]|nr:DUF177 domain-containing protein [Bacteroidales bacterium]MBN2699771.1 DUF177 domain-containing protein [Bacteroidales bacterium]
MKKRGEYAVRLSGLKEGIFELTYHIGNPFFECHPHPDISGGAVDVKITVQKRSDLLVLHLMLQGAVRVVCDRCLDYYLQTIQADQEIYFKYGDHEEELDGNVIMIARDAHEIIIDQYLYEYIVLALPIKKVHPDGPGGVPGCNQEMIQKLNQHLVKEEHQAIDPGWEVLKQIIEKTN